MVFCYGGVGWPHAGANYLIDGIVDGKQGNYTWRGHRIPNGYVDLGCRDVCKIYRIRHNKTQMLVYVA